MSAFLKWIFKEASVKELLLCILNLGHSYYSANISNTVIPVGGGVYYSWNHQTA